MSHLDSQRDVNGNIMKPSIFFVTLSLARGGTERHLAELTPRLAARGWRVTIFCLDAPGDFANAVQSAGVKVIAPRQGSALRRVVGTAKLAANLLKYRPKIIHCFLPAPYLIGGTLSVLTLRPIRLMSRRSQNKYMIKRPWAATIEKILHHGMTGILANSRAVAEELLRDEHVDPTRLGIIYNGVDLAKFAAPSDRAAVRARLGLQREAFVAVMVANLIPYKGHFDLIEAFAVIKDQLPVAWKLLLAGRDEGLGAEIRALARSKGLERHLELLGARNDVEELLQAADIGILSSHEEGFSNAVIEAMAAGLPMVVTDVGGNAEAVRQGVDGIVVPRGAVAELAQAIARLANDPDLRSKMGASGRERARTRYSIQSCVDQYEAVYNGLISGTRLCDIAPDGCPQAEPLA